MYAAQSALLSHLSAGGSGVDYNIRPGRRPQPPPSRSGEQDIVYRRYFGSDNFDISYELGEKWSSGNLTRADKSYRQKSAAPRRESRMERRDRELQEQREKFSTLQMMESNYDESDHQPIVGETHESHDISPELGEKWSSGNLTRSDKSLPQKSAAPRRESRMERRDRELQEQREKFSTLQMMESNYDESDHQPIVGQTHESHDISPELGEKWSSGNVTRADKSLPQKSAAPRRESRMERRDRELQEQREKFSTLQMMESNYDESDHQPIVGETHESHDISPELGEKWSSGNVTRADKSLPQKSAAPRRESRMERRDRELQEQREKFSTLQMMESNYDESHHQPIIGETHESHDISPELGEKWFSGNLTRADESLPQKSAAPRRESRMERRDRELQEQREKFSTLQMMESNRDENDPQPVISETHDNPDISPELAAAGTIPRPKKLIRKKRKENRVRFAAIDSRSKRDKSHFIQDKEGPIPAEQQVSRLERRDDVPSGIMSEEIRTASKAQPEPDVPSEIKSEENRTASKAQPEPTISVDIEQTHDEGDLDFFDLSVLDACGEAGRPKLASGGLETILKGLVAHEIQEIYFKSTLRFVSLPRHMSGLSGKAFEDFFDWLSTKGVRGITEIKIQDPGDNAHEHIQSSLRGGDGTLRFAGIKRFCWLNKNIDPVIIGVMLPEVEELWIEWNEHVPKRWENKLQNFKKLTKVHIVLRPGPAFPSTALAEKDSEDAASYCKQISCGSIGAECVEYRLVFSAKDDNIRECVDTIFKKQPIDGNIDPWLKYMQQVTRTDPAMEHRQRSGGLKAVRVAILDSGIDMFNPIFQKKVVGRKAFVGDTHDFFDLDGHGTHIAGLILKVAPHAELLIARVTGDQGKFSSAVIQEALTWARDQGADVINCSWGFNKPPAHIKDPMKLIDPESVVVFAAVENCGMRGSNYPWPARSPNAIAIGAADESGERWKHSQRIKRLDRTVPVFLLPGCDLTSNFPRYLDTGSPGSKTMSGTSMATGIASGLAARFLDYAKLFERVQDDNRKVQISNAFGDLCNDTGYVNPWDRLRSKTRLEALGFWLEEIFTFP